MGRPVSTRASPPLPMLTCTYTRAGDLEESPADGAVRSHDSVVLRTTPRPTTVPRFAMSRCVLPARTPPGPTRTTAAVPRYADSPRPGVAGGCDRREDAAQRTRGTARGHGA